MKQTKELKVKDWIQRLIRKYGHIWILGYTFIYIPWFLHLEKTVTRNYHIMHSELDDLIPFNEYFIIPYLLWFAYVGITIAYFFFTSREDYYRLCTFLFTGMTLSLLVCTLFPNGTDLRPVVSPDKNFCSWLVALLHQADTCTNVFPSIHVFNSIGVHISIIKSERLRKHRMLCAASFILMVSICMATVFLKQHSVLDVIGAILLCAAIYPLAYSGNTAHEQKPEPEFIR
ncbi:MAG: phosphoesterase [Clostridium sp.]|jgi:membrane-associated phospholipid phosphatase